MSVSIYKQNVTTLYSSVIQELGIFHSNKTSLLTLYMQDQRNLNHSINRYVTRLVSECNLLRNDKRQSAGHHWLREWCNYLDMQIFSKHYYNLWQNSMEKFISQSVLGAVAMPALAFFGLTLAVLHMPILWRLYRVKTHPLWCFLLWYNFVTFFYIAFDILPTWMVRNMKMVNYKGHPALCQVLSFLGNIVNFAPNLIVTLLLVEQVLARWYKKPRVATRFAAKGMLIAVMVGLFVVNVHTLWLYDTWRKSNDTKACDISTIHHRFFTQGYPLLLTTVHSTIPLAVTFLALIFMFAHRISKGTAFSEEQFIAVVQGVLFIIFHVPGQVNWYLVNSYHVKTRNFTHFKRMTLINKVIAAWCFLRYVVVIGSLLMISASARAEFKAQLAEFPSRMRQRVKQCCTRENEMQDDSGHRWTCRCTCLDSSSRGGLLLASRAEQEGRVSTCGVDCLCFGVARLAQHGMDEQKTLLRATKSTDGQKHVHVTLCSIEEHADVPQTAV